MTDRTASALEAFCKVVLDSVRYTDPDERRVKDAIEAHEALLDALMTERQLTSLGL